MAVKALVTGSSGFLGSAFVRRLLARDQIDLRCLVRTPVQPTDSTYATEAAGDARVSQVVGDLRSAEDVRTAVDGADIVYHIASATRGSPADMMASTVVGSKNLLEAIGNNPAMKVVLVSSFSVYGTAGLAPGAPVDETTPLEHQPERRDAYAYAKLRQERLFREYQGRNGFQLAVVRPGVIYGPGGSALSPRVGLEVFGLFLHLGRNTVVPLTYVDNCAEAIAVVGQHGDSWGESFNVVDDDLPTSKQFLREYRRRVKPIPYVTVPYSGMRAISSFVERYHRWSRGQLPAVFTPYKTASMWKGNTFGNERLKSLGWRPIVTTAEGIRRTMESLRGAERAS